jgi:hypothetical protein
MTTELAASNPWAIVVLLWDEMTKCKETGIEKGGN